MAGSKINAPEAMKLLDHVEGLIALGERRANIYVALNLALIVAAFQIDIGPSNALLLPVFLFFASLATGISLASLHPQRSHYQGDQWSEMRYALQFFSIAEFDDADEFIASFSEDNSPSVTNRLLLAVYDRSEWADRKFRYLKIASINSFGSVAAIGSMVVIELIPTFFPQRVP